MDKRYTICSSTKFHFCYFDKRYNWSMKKEEGSEPSEGLKSEVTHKDYFKSMTQLFTHTKKSASCKKEIKNK